MNYLYLLLITEIAFLLIHMAATQLDFTSPGFITLSIFILSTICVIWNEDYWDVEFEPLTYWLITAGLAVAIAVELLIKLLFQMHRKKVWIDQEKFIGFKGYQISTMTQLFSALIFTAMAAAYILAIIRAGGNNDLLTNIGVVHNDIEIEVGTIPTICIRVLRLEAFVYLYFFICNVFVCKQKFLQNALLLVPVIATLAAVFFSGVRSTFVYYFLAAFFYAVMLKRFKTSWRTVKFRKYFKYIVIFGSLFALMFIVTRTIVKNHEFKSTGMEYITFYLGSPIHLLNRIIKDTTQAFPTHYTDVLGAHTFKMFYQEMYKFGFMSFKVEETYFVAVGGGYHGGGNVYTIFGPSYHDFGFAGTMVYTAVFYAVFNFFYYKCFRYGIYIAKSHSALVLYGAYFYLVLMSYYGTLTAQLKLQTLLEMAVIVVLYKYIPRIKIRR